MECKLHYTKKIKNLPEFCEFLPSSSFVNYRFSAVYIKFFTVFLTWEGSLKELVVGSMGGGEF